MSSSKVLYFRGDGACGEGGMLRTEAMLPPSCLAARSPHERAEVSGWPGVRQGGAWVTM